MNLYENVYNTLRDDIQNGLIPSYSTLNETQLAERFNVSKITIKTALKKLCDEYYLKSHARKGYKLNTINHEEFAQLKELRMYYERFSIMQAIIRASDDEIKLLLEPMDNINPNADFHLRLAGLTKNKYHQEMVEKLLKIHYPMSLPKEKVAINHGNIVEELLKRNLSSALLYLEMDIALF